MYGITPSGKRSKFYCSKCQVFGHSMDRCFKVVGFPKDKGKRMANYRQNDEFVGSNDSTRIASNNPSPFSQEQIH